MAYLRLSDLKGQPRVGGKGFLPGVPHLTVSTFGSKKSNAGTAKGGYSYAAKNSARANRPSKRG